tara:strand:+ start:120 stop:350 length:231 start_codon:yes stop_codon:yes gene_type:complete
MVYTKDFNASACNMPIQRRDLQKIVVSMVEKSDADSEIFLPHNFIAFLLLPYVPPGYDSPLPTIDYSQILTDFYEN